MSPPAGWVECVPNFSEGRDETVIAALRDAIGRDGDAHLLDVHRDASHHRSVFTIAGPPAPVADAAVRAAATAITHIDLTQHDGVHPRIGAADVIPFVPLGRTTMADCVALAQTVAERIAALGTPVFLYAEAATAPDRRVLAAIRRRGSRLIPDFGTAFHPSAGATAVGARNFLVAFNVYLDTDDVAAARSIARTLRTSNGGLPGVQALGLMVGGRAQISMNLTDLSLTTPARVHRALLAEARTLGVPVAESEIVGLIPERSVDDGYDLALPTPVSSHLLEPRLRAAGWSDN